MKSHLILSAMIVATLASACRTNEVQCPKIHGIAHAAFYTSDYESTCKLYNEFFGYNNPNTFFRDNGEINFTAFKINDHQYVEIFKEREAGAPRFRHYSIETEDAEAMRLYLQSKGVKVPDKIQTSTIGDNYFFITDPNGIICEIMEYCKDGQTKANFGKEMREDRIATHISHIGFQCPDLDKAVSFYTDILGFQEVWRGGSNPEKVSWVHLGIPDSGQTLELMLYEKEPNKSGLGSMNHICLEVEDLDGSVEILNRRNYPATCKSPVGPKTGINKKRQMNYFDPDGTRVEIMSRETIDGIPAESSKGIPMKCM